MGLGVKLGFPAGDTVFSAQKSLVVSSEIKNTTNNNKWVIHLKTWRRYDEITRREDKSILFFFFFFFFAFPRATPAAYGGSQARAIQQSELQLPAYTTATAMWDPSRICDLHHSSHQHRILSRILNPLSKARDRT